MSIEPLELPQADDVYANYLATCGRLGVTPVTLERAAEPIAEWNAALEAVGKTKH